MTLYKSLTLTLDRVRDIFSKGSQKLSSAGVIFLYFFDGSCHPLTICRDGGQPFRDDVRLFLNQVMLESSTAM
jgi:hypothetical protein